MKRYQITLFILSTIATLGVMCHFFPEDGLTLTLKFPSLKEVMGEEKEEEPEVNVEELLAMSEKTAEIAASITSDLAPSHIRQTAEYVGALVYRFYSYGVQTYYTVNGEGEFYLPTTQVTKLISDAVRVTRDEVVNPDNAV